MGPKTENVELLKEMIKSGMNVARFNFSHGDYEEHKGRFDKVRALSKELDLPIACMLDTKGPEIRLGEFKNGVEKLTTGQKFTLTSRSVEGTNEICSVTYKELPHDVKPGGRIMLDDGLIELRIDEVGDTDIACTVCNDGIIKTKKGVNVPGVHLSMPYMSQRDTSDILFGVEQGFDLISASFARNAQDIMDIRHILDEHNSKIRIIAKIENQEGIDNIDEILTVADGIMVARGDMGVEIDFTEIPIIQKDTMEQDVPPGTGPYKFESTERLVRNTDWWQDSAPLVDYDEITLTSVSTTAEIRDNFEYENINMVLTDPNSAAYAGFHNDYELWDAKSPIMQYVGYNINSKVFSNYGLRSAITYAIDREHIATDIMGGFAQAAVLPASPDAPFYDVKLANTYGYSLTKFQQQLESASVEDMDHDGTLDLYVSSLGYAVPVSGTMIVCSSSYQRVEAATEVVNALNALGFKITLKTLELSEFRQALQTGNFDLYYGEIRLSNNFDLTPFFSASGSMCYGGLDDSVMLNLCTQALANNGNSYNLYKRLCERGYITPVLFKNLAVYTTRGSIAHPTDYIDWFLIPPADETAEG